jgi:AcrR family transcriptional regulator
MSVNNEKTAYHHGDLRTALIRAGLDLLADRDLEGLSLREVARAVGVSAPSVYRHFPDKQALMTALAREGLDRLSIAQHAAVMGVEEGGAAFAAAGRAYVRFALANPALFRLIFASSVFAIEASDGMTSAAPRIMRDGAPTAAAGFFDAVAGKESERDPDTLIRAIRAYAMVHGLATLMLDGQIAQDDSLIDRVIYPPGERQAAKS